MFPRTLLIVVAALLTLSACGTPPGAEPEPTYTPAPSLAIPSGPIRTTPPTTLPPITWATPTVTPTTVTPTTVTPTTTSGTTGPATIAATPTPSHAPKCTGSPTAAQLLALVKDEPGFPTDKTLKVTDGPYCAGGWAYAAVGVTGEDPLMVLTTGADATLKVVLAGSDVCSTPVQTGAPAGIRVLACGF